MRKRVKTYLNLTANPFAAIDADGFPCGACPPDPVEDTGRRGHIGARIASAEEVRAKVSRMVGRKEQILSLARHEITWAFDAEPVRLPNTGYYRDRVADGSLIAADAESAKLAGVEFVAPEKLIEAARVKRVAEYDAQHGAGAWLARNGEFVAETKTKPEADSAASAPSRTAKK